MIWVSVVVCCKLSTDDNCWALLNSGSSVLVVRYQDRITAKSEIAGRQSLYSKKFVLNNQRGSEEKLFVQKSSTIHEVFLLESITQIRDVKQLGLTKTEKENVQNYRINCQGEK